MLDHMGQDQLLEGILWKIFQGVGHHVCIIPDQAGLGD